MRAPRYGELHTATLPSQVRAIWYSKDEELEPEPRISLCDNEWQDASQIESQMDDRKLALSLLFATTRKEADVLSMRYMRDMTLEEVGFAYGVSRERIRQIEAKAMRKIRRRFQTHGAEGCIKQYRDYIKEVT